MTINWKGVKDKSNTSQQRETTGRFEGPPELVVASAAKPEENA